MDPIYLSIRLKETGDRIKNLIKARGYTVRDVQGAMGFENPQAIYKWMAGRTLPSLDNLIILSRILHTKMEDILVIDGDVVFCDRRTVPLSQKHKVPSPPVTPYEVTRFRPLRGHLMTGIKLPV